MSRVGSAVLLAGIAAAGLRAQTYSVTEVVAVPGGAKWTQTVYRNGSKVVVDYPLTRSLYDLQARVRYTWTLADPGGACGSATFSGDWGDPFALSAVAADQIAKQLAKVTGAETMNGVATRVVEIPNPPGGTVKLWQDPKSTLVLRAQLVPPSGPAFTVADVQKFGMAAPDPALFVLPAGCHLPAKPVEPPQTYTITRLASPATGGQLRITTYRNGSKAVADRPLTRSLYDLTAHVQYTWALANPGGVCQSASFTGDWGDPFFLSPITEDQIAKQLAKVTGAETLNGIAARIVESPTNPPGGTVKLWQDPKSSLVLRVQRIPAGGPAVTVIDVVSFSTTAPDPSLFVLPPGCQAPAMPAGPPLTYTITQLVLLPGGAQGRQNIYRNGSKAVTEGARIRILFDLQAHIDYQWDIAAPSGCRSEHYSGDWPDPFAGLGLIEDRIAKGMAKVTGTDTVNGIPARTVESPLPTGGISRVWQDPRSTLELRRQQVPSSGPAVTWLEVQTFSTAAPDPAVFVLPAGCTAPARPVVP